jgi:hypothetical protein
MLRCEPQASLEACSAHIQSYFFYVFGALPGLLTWQARLGDPLGEPDFPNVVADQPPHVV